MNATPGPWEYDAENQQVVAPKCGYHRGTMAGAPIICELAELDYGETPGNGAMLAASPALYRALVQAAGLIMQEVPQTPRRAAVLLGALEAIAAADGGQALPKPQPPEMCIRCGRTVDTAEEPGKYLTLRGWYCKDCDDQVNDR
jgi:hypothetical protein